MEKELNDLFTKARQTPKETNIQEVYQWMGYSSFATLLTIFLLKIKKVFILKTLVMVSTIFTVASIATLAFIYSGDEQPSANPNQVASFVEVEQRVNDSAVLKNQRPQTDRANPIESDIPSPSPTQNPSPLPPEIDRLPQVAAEEIAATPEQVVEPQEPGANLLSGTFLLGAVEEVGSFTKIVISGALDVSLIQGSSCSVKASKWPNGNSRVKVENKNGVLYLSNGNAGPRHGRNHNDGDNEHDEDHDHDGAWAEEGDDDLDGYEVVVTFVVLEELTTSGASDIESDGSFNLDRFVLKSSGASDIELKLTANSVEVNSSGASDIEITGTTDELKVENSGASDIDLDKLKAKKVKVYCSGAANTCVYASESIDAKVSGVSSVCYAGNPSEERADVSKMSSFTKHR